MGTKSKVIMFIGAVLMAILLMVELPISFGVWLTLFLLSMLTATIGAVMAIFRLGKSIKQDYIEKTKEK